MDVNGRLKPLLWRRTSRRSWYLFSSMYRCSDALPNPQFKIQTAIDADSACNSDSPCAGDNEFVGIFTFFR